MSYVECCRCHSSIRAWQERTQGELSDEARSAPDAVVVDESRNLRCPFCGVEQVLPVGGVYLIYDRDENLVRYVGRSSDSARRLEWWQRPGGGRYADRTRYRGVQLATAGAFPDVAWFAAGDKE